MKAGKLLRQTRADHEGNFDMGVGHDQLLESDMHTNQLDGYFVK
jgi:hypothetical protein